MDEYWTANVQGLNHGLTPADADPGPNPVPPRRRLQAYSLDKKVRYVDEYWTANVQGLHGRTPADFARFRNKYE